MALALMVLVLTAAMDSWIRVNDTVLPEQRRREVHDFLIGGSGVPWRFGWKSRAKQDPFAFWHRHFAGFRDVAEENDAYDCEPELEAVPLILDVWRHLASQLLVGHRLIRCYANGLTYGSDGTLHSDSSLPNTYTTVYYPHEIWSPDWGGETMFFNPERNDVVACVYPKPNRLLTFDGRVWHVARGLSRICPVLRVTLMFKTDTKDAG